MHPVSSGQGPKIVYVAEQKPAPGRAPTLQILHTLRGLCAAEGARVKYVTPWPVELVRRRWAELAGHQVPDGLEIVSLGPGPDLPLVSWLWPAPVWAGIRARLLRYLTQIAQTEQGIVVYTRSRRVAAELGSADLPPVVFESHEPRSLVEGETRGLPEDHAVVQGIRNEERRALERSAGVVTVTLCQAQEIRSDHSFTGPVWVIPNAADPDIFQVSDNDRRPCAGRLLYIGSLYPWKGLDLALQAVARVPSAELHICGGMPSTPAWHALTQFARGLHVLDRVHLHGTIPQPQLRPLLASSVAGLLPLDGRHSIAARYTSPLKLFEYLCAGLPVVATDLPSVREIVTHEREGLLFADGDVHSLADALGRLLSDSALAARLAKGAREASANFTWKRRGERIIEACRTVLELRASGKGRIAA